MRLTTLTRIAARRIGAAITKAAGGDWERAFRREEVYGDTESYGVRLFDQMTERVDAMANVGIVYACVNLIAQSFAQVPWHFEDADGNEVEIPELQALLTAPNPDTSGLELFYTIMAHLELTGNAFLYLGGIDGSALFARDAKGQPYFGRDGKLTPGARPHFGKPRELFILEPDCMKIGKTANDRIAGYAYRSPLSHQDVPLERDWVLHLKYPHPGNRWWGLGPVEAASLALEQTIYADRWNRNFFRNSARPDGVIETEKQLDDAQFARLEASWKASHKGVNQAHRTAILEAAKYHPVSMGAKDMDFFSGKELTREEVCSIFGVPPAKIGVLRYANYANSREQDKTFWAETMTPKLMLVAAKVTAELCARWDEGLRFMFADMNPRDAALEADTAVKLIGVGARTINEMRAEYGWGDDVPWGDAFWIQAGRYPIVGTEAPPQATAASAAPAAPVAATTGERNDEDSEAAAKSHGSAAADAPRSTDTGGATPWIRGADPPTEPAAVTPPLRPSSAEPHADWEAYWRKAMADPQEALEPGYRRELLPLFQAQQREVTDALRVSEELASLVEAGAGAEALATAAAADKMLAEFLEADDLMGVSNRHLKRARWQTEDPRRRFVAQRVGELSADSRAVEAIVDEVCAHGLEGLVERVKAPVRRQVEVLVEGAIDWNGQRETFRVTMEPQYSIAVELAGNGALQELGVATAFNLADPDALRALNVIAHRFAADVNDTTKRGIQDALYAGLEKGEGVPKLMDRVKDVFAEAKGPRAETIARTETARAVNAGRLEGYRQSGVVERQEWIATFDSVVRPEHLAAHGQVVALGDPFNVGGEDLAYPGDPGGSAENTINCRCTLAAVIEGEI